MSERCPLSLELWRQLATDPAYPWYREPIDVTALIDALEWAHARISLLKQETAERMEMVYRERDEARAALRAYEEARK
mgnify:CR=1 FL=1